jgi:hypothetical protein
MARHRAIQFLFREQSWQLAVFQIVTQGTGIFLHVPIVVCICHYERKSRVEHVEGFYRSDWK